MDKSVKVSFECLTSTSEEANKVVGALVKINAPTSSIGIKHTAQIQGPVEMTPENIKTILKKLDWTYGKLAIQLSTPFSKVSESEVKGWLSGSRGLSKMGKSAMYHVLKDYIPEI